MAILHITKENFEQEVLKAEKPVLVDFFATWCGPCKMIGPVVEQIASENDDISVVKIDIDEEPELASKYQVTGVPTIMLFKGGEVKDISVGVVPKSKLESMFK